MPRSLSSYFGKLDKLLSFGSACPARGIQGCIAWAARYLSLPQTPSGPPGPEQGPAWRMLQQLLLTRLAQPAVWAPATDGPEGRFWEELPKEAASRGAGAILASGGLLGETSG